jgi:hypothetical protein
VNLSSAILRTWHISQIPTIGFVFAFFHSYNIQFSGTNVLEISTRINCCNNCRKKTTSQDEKKKATPC